MLNCVHRLVSITTKEVETTLDEVIVQSIIEWIPGLAIDLEHKELLKMKMIVAETSFLLAITENTSELLIAQFMYCLALFDLTFPRVLGATMPQIDRISIFSIYGLNAQDMVPSPLSKKWLLKQVMPLLFNLEALELKDSQVAVITGRHLNILTHILASIPPAHLDTSAAPSKYHEELQDFLARFMTRTASASSQEMSQRLYKTYKLFLVEKCTPELQSEILTTLLTYNSPQINVAALSILHVLINTNQSSESIFGIETLKNTFFLIVFDSCNQIYGKDNIDSFFDRFDSIMHALNLNIYILIRFGACVSLDFAKGIKRCCGDYEKLIGDQEKMQELCVKFGEANALKWKEKTVMIHTTISRIFELGNFES